MSRKLDSMKNLLYHLLNMEAEGLERGPPTVYNVCSVLYFLICVSTFITGEMKLGTINKIHISGLSALTLSVSALLIDNISGGAYTRELSRITGVSAPFIYPTTPVPMPSQEKCANDSALYHVAHLWECSQFSKDSLAGPCAYKPRDLESIYLDVPGLLLLLDSNGGLELIWHRNIRLHFSTRDELRRYCWSRSLVLHCIYVCVWHVAVE